MEHPIYRPSPTIGKYRPTPPTTSISRLDCSLFGRQPIHVHCLEISVSSLPHPPLIAAMDSQSPASKFLQSYASAMHTAQDPSTTPASCATVLASHYLPGMTSFTHGTQHRFEAQEDAISGIKIHLERLEKTGWGFDIRLDDSRVEVVSEGSALCWATWRIDPKNGVEGWSWRNVYGYRKGQDSKQGWEFVISDEEVAGIFKRAPEFFSS